MSIFGGIGSVVGADIIAYVKLSGAETFNRDLDKLNQNAASFGKAMNATMNAAVIGAGVAFVGASAAAIQFESSFAGVLKTTEGLTDEFGAINAEGVKLSEEFRKLALEIPISVNELNRIGELGGQLGIAKGDLVKFTEVIAKLGATTDLSYEQGATAIAQFINVTKNVVPSGLSVQGQIERIASALVDLGNKSVATESGIMEFAQRLAGAGATIGLTQDQILSFGAAFSSVGLNAEMGATAFSRLMIDMKRNVELGGEKLQVFSKIAGVDFKEAFEKDASSAIVSFVEGLNNISKSGGSVVGALKDLGINEARMTSALLLAANAGDLLNDTLGVGAKAYKDNTALTDEFAKRVQTTGAQLKLLQNAVYDVLIDLGQEFLPTIRAVANAMAEHPEVIKAIILALMAGGGLVAAFKALHAAQVAFQKLKAIDMFSKFAGSIGASSMAMTALGAVSIAALAKIIDLIGAIQKYKDAQEELAKANQRVEDVNTIMMRGMGSMNSALYTLGQHARTDMVVVNGKLQQVGTAIDNINKLIGEGHVTDIKLQFGEAAVKAAEAALALQEYADNLEELKKAGIETTEEIMSQISAFEKLKTAFGDDKAVVFELNNKIDELKSKLAESGNIWAMTSVAIDNMSDTQRRSKVVTDEMVQSLVDVNGKVIDLNASTYDFTDANERARQESDAFKNVIGAVTDKLGPVGDAINVLVSGLMTGATPLTMALNLASIAINSLYDSNEHVKLSIEEVISAVYGANSAMVEYHKTISQGAVSELERSDIINDLTTKYNKYTEELAELYNLWEKAKAHGDNASMRAYSKEIKEVGLQAEETAEALNKLINAFTFVDQSIQEQSQYITENAIAAWERYAGAIPDGKTREWLMLLEENTADLVALRDTLVVGSQAWKDNEEAILRNQYVMGLINGDWVDYAEYVREANLSMEQAAWLLESLGYEGEALDNALLELGLTTQRTTDNMGSFVQVNRENLSDAEAYAKRVEEINDEMAIWQSRLDEAKTKQAEINSVLEESTKRFNEQKSAIQANIDTWQSELDAIDKEINWNVDLTPPTLKEIGAAMQELNDKILAASEEMAAIELKITGLEAEKQEAIDAYIASLDILISKAGELKIAWGDSVDTTISNFETLFGSGTDSWTNKALAAIEQLKYFKIDLDTTDADESIAGTIVKMQEYLGTLAPGSPAYIAASDSLNNLITQYGTLGTAFSTEVGVNFNNEQAISGIAEIDTSYEGQIEKLRTEQLVIAVNLLTYNQALNQLGVSYNNKLAELQARKLVVQADISGAESTLAALQRNYDNLRAALQAQYIAVSANTSAASQALYYLRQELTNLTANPYVVTITANSNLPSQHTGGMLYHSGGWIVAHDGMSLGQYGSMKEVPFLGLEGEYVMNPNIGRKFGEAALDAFNVSGNPAVLGGGMAQQKAPSIEFKPEVVINNAAPETFVTWTDKYIHPRIRDNDDRQIKRDRFK